MGHHADQHGKQPRFRSALGWASLGLGAAPLLWPDRVLQATGADDRPENRTLARAVGLRELAVGTGLLASRRRGPWHWARVAQDAMDLAVLRHALSGKKGEQRSRLEVTTMAVAAIAVVDVAAAVRSRRRGRGRPRQRAAVTVRRPVDEVYRYWRDFENLPTFMTHVASVTTAGETRSHWSVTAPAGRTVEWDAEITEDVPGERISWRSVKRADVPNRGTVTFRPAPGERGTEVHVEVEYDVPGGKAGEVVAKLAGEEPHQQIKDDLRRFKQVLETGEVVRSEGSPEGQRASRLLTQRSAQPLTHVDATA